MFKLRLDGKLCISCGICMDVCQPKAISMRSNDISGIEGKSLLYLHLKSHTNAERPPEQMMTFPYSAYPHFCDGCMLCVNECPVLALELQGFHQTTIAFTN